MNYKPLKLSEYYGKNYDEFLTLLKGTTVMKTGKSGKKSSTIARNIVFRLITDGTFCAIVLRKVNLDHEKSTIPAITKAFNKYQSLTGYDWRRDWVVNKGAKNPHIINIRTNQIIRFVSFDRPESMAGLELEELYLHYQMIWFEEPMQISDKDTSSNKSNAEKQLKEERDFDIIVSSAFRGNPPPHVHREIVFSFNDWSDGDYWIIDKYVKPFINEVPDILDKKGKQVHYDPEFENGKGILVLVASGGINEFNDEDYINFIKSIKKNDPEFYKAIWLGTAAQIIGNAYAKANLNKVILKDGHERVTDWLIGIDYSSTKDFIAIVLSGTNDNQEFIVVDGWGYHRGKAKNPLSEPELIKFLWEKIEFWSKKYNFASTSEFKASVRVDARDSVVRSYLEEHYHEATANYRTDIDIPMPAKKFKSSSNWIRVMATRYIMGAGKFWLSPKLKQLWQELINRRITKDGGITDGNDDFAQAMEYCFSHILDVILPRNVYIQLQETYNNMIIERNINGK